MKIKRVDLNVQQDVETECSYQLPRYLDDAVWYDVETECSYQLPRYLDNAVWYQCEADFNIVFIEEAIRNSIMDTICFTTIDVFPIYL